MKILICLIFAASLMAAFALSYLILLTAKAEEEQEREEEE